MDSATHAATVSNPSAAPPAAPDAGSDAFAPVVVMPSYNNAGTLPDILRRVETQGLPMIVVNDGSTDATPQILADWAAGPRTVKVRVVTHERNRGKATALKSGFAAALEAGFTHALTIDTDGQLDPEQIPQFIAAARHAPAAYVLGVRDDTAADYPARSRIGRRISNTMIRLESRVRVSDSQCGLRVYPMQLIRTVHCRARFFGFEAEIITRAAWSGCPIVEVTANCRYLPPDQRVSHFRPWLDTLRGFLMHLRLLLRSWLPLPHPKYGSISPSRVRKP